MTKEDEILEILNKMIIACEPIQFHEFNRIIKEKERDSLGKVEREDNRVGLRLAEYENPTSGFAISTASIIATITDICVGKRLAFKLEHGNIVGVRWYKE